MCSFFKCDKKTHSCLFIILKQRVNNQQLQTRVHDLYFSNINYIISFSYFTISLILPIIIICLGYALTYSATAHIKRGLQLTIILQAMTSLFDFSEARGIHIDYAPQDKQKQQSIYEHQIDQNFNPAWHLKILIAYSYFIQGMVFALPETMTLVYSKLPSYTILSIFSAASIPFSIKFILAPFIEKFTLLKYGKRKFWIVLSQISVISIILVASFFTDQKYQAWMGFFMVLMMFFVALQDISLDSLAIKELRIPHLVGAVQAIFQSLGTVLGSMLLLKLTSQQFASGFNLAHPITTPQTIFRCVAIALTIPTIVMHTLYKERKLRSEKKVNKKSFWEIVSFYRIFFDIKSRYCLTCIMFIFYIQGFNYFIAGFQYQLIHAGFKRNTLNTITNFNIIPISFITYLLSDRVGQISPYKILLIYMIIRWVFYLFAYITFPTDNISVAIIVFIFQALDNFKFFIVTVIVNQFPVSGISGMLITMLVSSANFGSFKAIAMYVTGKFGWDTVAGFGLLLQIAIMLLYSQFYQIVQKSKTEQMLKLSEQEQGKDEEEIDNIHHEYIRKALEPSIFIASSYDHKHTFFENVSESETSLKYT